MSPLNKIHIGCPGCGKNICDGCQIYEKINTRKNTPIYFPDSFQGDRQEGYGISFDLGTTTICAMLWNLETSALLNVETITNPQAKFGADIISRLQYAANERHGLDELQNVVVLGMDELANQLTQVDAVDKTQIKKAVIVGNTIMCQLFLHIEPVRILAPPFLPDYTDMISVKGKKLGFSLLTDTQFLILPPVAGFVGSDMLAAYHALHTEHRDGNILLVDIGTNAEILLKKEERLYCCSVAAGPALEGGNISCGMRATKGAIDEVNFFGQFPMQSITYHVIGNTKPQGICGSGLISLLATLLEAGVVNKNGYLLSKQEAMNGGVPARIAANLYSTDKGNAYFLNQDESTVALYAQDIYALVLAIAAIRAGMETLLNITQTHNSEIDALVIAGSFGSYIDLKAGLELGLFPTIEKSKFIFSGNLAGRGAAMALLAKDWLASTNQLTTSIKHIELADTPEFQQNFVKYMTLGEKE